MHVRSWEVIRIVWAKKDVIVSKIFKYHGVVKGGGVSWVNHRRYSSACRYWAHISNSAIREPDKKGRNAHLGHLGQSKAAPQRARRKVVMQGPQKKEYWCKVFLHEGFCSIYITYSHTLQWREISFDRDRFSTLIQKCGEVFYSWEIFPVEADAIQGNFPTIVAFLQGDLVLIPGSISQAQSVTVPGRDNPSPACTANNC